MYDTPLPTIEAPPAVPATIEPPAMLAPISIKATVLAQFAAAEATLTTLAAKYHGVAFDVTSTKGLAEAKAARLDLRENGRFMVERAEKRVRADVNDLKRVMADEVERLVKIVRPSEDAIHAQIEAEETRKAAEKAERERLAAERAAKFGAQLDTIRGYAKAAAGLPAATIAKGIAALEAMTFGAEWEDFQSAATDTRDLTLSVLRTMHEAAAQREADDAERERQRQENARVAAGLAEQRKQLAAQEAELKRQAEAQRAAQAAAEQAEADRLAEARRAAQAAMTYPNGAPMYGKHVKENGDLMMLDDQGARSIFCDVDEGAEVELPAATVAPAPVAGVESMPEAPMPLFLELGDIEALLGFPMSRQFITNVLGISPSATDGDAPLFNPSQWVVICDALLAHVSNVKANS